MHTIFKKTVFTTWKTNNKQNTQKNQTESMYASKLFPNRQKLAVDVSIV